MDAQTDKPTVLVTGAAKRVGRAIAQDLAKGGWPVALHYNTSAKDAEALADQINRAGGKAITVGADLRDADAVRGIIATANAKLASPIQVVVNNASMFKDDDIAAVDLAQFDAHMNVHVKAPALLAEQLLSHIPDGHDGLIVNIIDQRVWALTPRFFSYTLSKSALWAMTQTLAQRLAPSIRVNAIGPGPTLANERQDPNDFAKQVDGVLLKRGADLSEFAATIRYMWEARSMTGQMIALDGGQHLAWETPDVAGLTE